MLKQWITWSARNPALVLLATALVASAGVWAMWQTPVDAIPDLSDVQVIVKTEYPGQGPQIVEEQVTYPLTTALLGVPHAQTVRGYSMFGTSFVYVIFDEGTDVYWARSRVLEYLNTLSGTLPALAKPSLGPDATGVGWIYEYAVIDRTGQHNLSELRAVQDFFLKYELQAVDGVAEIATVGGFVKQYQVVADPQKLAAYGITLLQVREALQRSNNDVGGRLLEQGEREFIVRGKGYLKGIEDIRAVPLTAHSGMPLQLGDVARVRLGPDLRRGIAELDGAGEVVGGIVVMRYGENALRVIDRVKARIETLKPGLPAGVEIVPTYDRSTLIDEAVTTLSTKLWQELAVVALIVFLFLLHVRSALVAVLTVPIGILMALLVMYGLGINANIMSLGGIAIAIGVMVDAALVMVENAHKHLERAGPAVSSAERLQVIMEAAREVGPSLFFSLLIVTVSFLPVFTLEQIEGRLFRPLALTKTFAMAAAALLAVTLVPALMVTFIKGNVRPEARNPVSRMAIRLYRPVIQWTLRHPALVLWIGAGVLLVTLLPVQRVLLDRVWVPFPQIGTEFMPPLNEGDLLYMPTTLPGISPQKAREVLQQTDRIIKTFPEVARVFGKAGRADTATDPAPLSMLETIILLKPPSEWRAGMTREKLIRELDAALQIPGLTNAWTMPIRTRIDMLATGIRTPVGIKVSGPDLATLERIGRELEGALQPLAGTVSVYAERAVGGMFLDVTVNREAAARYGLTSDAVQSVVATAVGGMNVTATVEGLERYPINVRYPRALRDNLPALRNVLVPTPSGAVVPLGQVADFTRVPGPSVIKSENARPNAWVYVDLEDGVDLGAYVQRAQAIVAERVDLPTGYAVKWSGQYEYLERAGKRLQVLIPLTLLVIFLLLFVHFRSGAEALMLMLPLPFAVVGAVWLMVVLGFKMSVAVVVGLIAVAGLAAETGLVMHVYLDEALRRYRAEGRLTSAKHLNQALEEGAVERVRPKLMTVCTTILGLLPIMFGTEVGTEVMQRIATPMVGGLLTSTIHTLIMIPALYALVERRRMRVAQPMEGA